MTRPTPPRSPFFTARAGFRTLLLALCLAAVPFRAHGAGPSLASEDAAPATAAMTGGQRAQLVAIRQAVISSELAGKIISLRFREGERFKKGDTLVSYDSALSRARLDRAVQAETAARKRLKIAKDLRRLNSISVSDYEQARSDVAVAEAETRAERVMVNRCRIKAPFSGRVGETYTHEAEYVGEGTRLLSVYDDSAFEIETILPSRWLAWLRPDYPMTITVDETGGSYRARVTRIAGVIDPVSQSVKVIALIEKKTDANGGVPLMPGMSGTVFVAPPQTRENTAE